MPFRKTIIYILLVMSFSGCVSMAKKGKRIQDKSLVTVRITLDNNDKITGKFVNVYKGKVKVKHKTLGDLSFKWEKLSSITTDGNVRIRLKSGDKVTGRLVDAKKGLFKIEGPEVRSEELGLKEITGINEPENDVTWKGEALFSYIRTAGNKRTSDSAFLFRGVRETGIDSIALKAAYNYGTNEDDLSKRSSMGLLKYNYKLSESFYAYMSTGASMDYFKGLNLRTDIGGGEGWKAYDREDFSLLFELGLSYSNEDYIEPTPPQPDKDVRYGAGRSAAELEVNLNDAMTFYQLVEFFTPFDHAKYWRFHSESVLSVNLGSNLSVKAGYILDHDRRAPEGTKRTDGKTMVGIGFKF